MNGGYIIFVDEFIGVFDSYSGVEVMVLFDELVSQGYVVILIIYDCDVVVCVKCIIEVCDGEIVSDSVNDECLVYLSVGVECYLQVDDFSQCFVEGSSEFLGVWCVELLEVVCVVWWVMWINWFCIVLILFGIIIGVVLVVVMFVVGEGSKCQVMVQMGVFGLNIIYFSGYLLNLCVLMGIVSSDDVVVIVILFQVKKVMLVNGGELVVCYGNIDYYVYVGGNNIDFLEIFNWLVVEGSYFIECDEDVVIMVVVIGYKVCKKLFGSVNLIGCYIFIENVLFQVIGVFVEKGFSFGDKDVDNCIVIFYFVVSICLFGMCNFEYVIIVVVDVQCVYQVECVIDQLMLCLYCGQCDYELINNVVMIQVEVKIQNILLLMFGLIVVIFLLVGGIGVMNIMFMIVCECICEIGICMVIGVCQGDIFCQFFIEVVMFLVVGGLVGIVLVLCIGGVLLFGQVVVVFFLLVIVGVFSCVLVIGLVFGFMLVCKVVQLDLVVVLVS